MIPQDCLKAIIKMVEKTVVFKDLAAVKSKEKQLKKVVREWLKLVEK